MIGDGGFVFALEKRGYVKAGPWTPEATKEHPEAGENEALLTFDWTDLWVRSPHDVIGLVCSASAAQGVPEGRGQRHADLHLLRQR